MTCRQSINGVLYPRQRHVSDTHLDIAEKLRADLAKVIGKLYPDPAYPDTCLVYAEEIIDQAFDAIHDLSMDIDASTEEDY